MPRTSYCMCTTACTPAYVSIRQHTSACVMPRTSYCMYTTACTPAYASIRQHTPAYVTVVACGSVRAATCVHHLVHIIDPQHQHTSAYVTAHLSIRQHTSPGSYHRPAVSAYLSIRQHTSQHTSAYVTWFILSTRSTLLSFLEGESIESCEFTYRRLLLSVFIFLY